MKLRAHHVYNNIIYLSVLTLKPPNFVVHIYITTKSKIKVRYRQAVKPPQYQSFLGCREATKDKTGGGNQTDFMMARTFRSVQMNRK